MMSFTTHIYSNLTTSSQRDRLPLDTKPLQWIQPSWPALMHVPNITFWYIIFKLFPILLWPLNFVIKINKPFAVAPSLAPLAPPSFSTLAILANPTQSFSHPGQHSSGSHSLQGVEELPQEDTQKPSKQPNKMRVNKHSITPRYVPYTTNISNIDKEPLH